MNFLGQFRFVIDRGAMFADYWLIYKQCCSFSVAPQTANGNVEAKVVCLFRRRDISSSLNSLADSNARE